MTPAVEFRDLCKSYGGATAVDRINLLVESGEFLTLLGPSGSGKTTLLNIISGMVLPSSGSVLIEGNDVTQIPPRHRGLGMVFQNYALLPHMTVFENIAFPLRIRKMPRAVIEEKVMAVLSLVRLTDFAGRKPRELSGGQQQRVSIARCLVYEPKLILMDEPLGALDKKLRLQLQLEIKKIHEELGVTILYVTHDQEEALVLSDRICVMNNARIEQIGAPNDLYFRPANEFVADFLGESNLIPGEVESAGDGSINVRTDDGTRLCALARSAVRPGDRVKVLVRPEAVQICPRDERAGECGMNGIIRDRIFVGQSTKYIVTAGNLCIAAQLGNSSQTRTFTKGEQIWVGWARADSVVLNPN
ncbi:MAG TPA: ABC transporter ATP-binding protein [Pseudolabrys sp.]|nr:ABC transporter ATP-binding protein [Pseudolabrys sp.]